MTTSLTRFHTGARKRGTALALSAFLASGLTVVTVPAAHAAEEPTPEASSVFEGEIDTKDPDLKIPEGGTLGEPKVLEIKQVIGDENEEEQREDSESNTKFTLQAEVLFGKDSSKLNSKANARISDIANEISEQGAKKVNVFGFTDNLGSYAHGEKLSQERAEAVHKQLTKDLDSGITFNIRGYSEDYPVADNATEEGRKKNRRVEVSFPRNE